VDVNDGMTNGEIRTWILGGIDSIGVRDYHRISIERGKNGGLEIMDRRKGNGI